MHKMNKVLGGQQYIANFLDQPLRVGSIIRMDDKQSILALHVNDAFPDIDLGKFTESGSKGSLKFSEEKAVSVTFGGSAKSTLGKSEVSLQFKRARTAAGVFDDVRVEALRFETIKQQLRQIWEGKGYDQFLSDYFLVFETITAGSGTLIYSEDRDNTVILGHVLGDTVTKLADLGSGQFEYVSNTKRTLEIIRTVAHKPLFKAFRFRGNWEPEILG